MSHQFYFRSFKLGGLYYLIFYPERILKFIKVTKKGYNLLDIESNKCILYRHLYSSTYSNKEIPENINVLKNIRVPYWLVLKETVEVNKGT